jgi:hypothetical protein
MKNDGLAIASLVLGLVGFVLDWIPGVSIIGLICAVLAIIFAITARNKIKNSNGELGGSGMATAGLILGIVVVAFYIIALIACGAFISSMAL